MIGVPRVGRCNTCGRLAPGVLKPGSLRECEGACPRCGNTPYYLDHIAPYTGNVARMSERQAMRFIDTVDDPAELEVIFRLEVLGTRPRGRDRVIEYAYARYWELAMYEDPFERAIILPLEEARAAWWAALHDPQERAYYTGLMAAACA